MGKKHVTNHDIVQEITVKHTEKVFCHIVKEAF